MRKPLIQTGTLYSEGGGRSMSKRGLMSRLFESGEQGVGDLLPFMPPACVEVLNAFYQRRDPIKAHAFGRTIQIEPAFEREQSHQRFLRLEIEVDGDMGTLLIPSPLADLVFLELDGSPNIADFDPQQAALLMELALRGMLEAIEAGIGGKIFLISVASRIEPFERLPEPLFRFGLSIAKLGLLHIYLHLPARSSLRLAHYMNANTTRRTEDAQELAALTFSVCIRLGAFAFSQRDLGQSAAGDVILLDQKSTVLPGAALVIGETLAAPLEIIDSNAILVDAPKIALGTVLEGLTATGIESWFQQDKLNRDNDGVPIIMTFELRRFHVSLEDLRFYRRGTAIPLGSDGNDLEMLANGKMVGLGKLITIGDSTGVMVTRLVQRQSTLGSIFS
jgi:Type III flagellar switch regulator (C-ring) FliN C-term